MSSEQPTRRLQFSLRTFLFVILVVGPVAGVVVPVIIESITQWKPPPNPRGSQQVLPRSAPATETDSYFESGETPLY